MTNDETHNERGLLDAAIGDGRPLLLLVALGLVISGGFALFLALTHQFLPHDIDYLGMTEDELCAVNGCRVAHFMIHDRIAFGGSLISVGILYFWLVEFPLRAREPWAWWTLAASAVLGFGSFLSYLGYGYLDTWHGAATLLLLPLYVEGLRRTYPGRGAGFPSPRARWANRPRGQAGAGWLALLGVAGGMIAGGATIMIIGMTRVFVPQDLDFMRIDRAGLDAINPRLVSLIAHDRAGYGGAVATTGVVLMLALWFARPSRAFWQAIALAGGIGFATAIGAHPFTGYNNVGHLLPAYLGAVLLVAGVALSYPLFYGADARATNAAFPRDPAVARSPAIHDASSPVSRR